MSRSGTATISYTVVFGTTPKSLEPETPGHVPRVTRMLALAHSIDEMIRTGELRDLSDAAKVMFLTRARMTQIMNLLTLAPEIQDAILDLPSETTGRDPITERRLRRITAEPGWKKQTKKWRQIYE